MIQFDEHIFQMGWNHQLVMILSNLCGGSNFPRGNGESRLEGNLRGAGISKGWLGSKYRIEDCWWSGNNLELRTTSSFMVVSIGWFKIFTLEIACLTKHPLRTGFLEFQVLLLFIVISSLLNSRSYIVWFWSSNWAQGLKACRDSFCWCFEESSRSKDVSNAFN